MVAEGCAMCYVASMTGAEAQYVLAMHENTLFVGKALGKKSEFRCH